MGNRNIKLTLERNAIESKFSSENWSQMNFGQRLQACRELENNYAAERGVQPCEVTYEYMDGGTYGYQSNGVITLNAYVLEEGNFHTLLRDDNNAIIRDENGVPMETTVPINGANWATMETVYHEGTHGVQEAEGRLSRTYIDSEADYSLYRIQACEREAFATGQFRTLEAIQNYQQSSGKLDAEAMNYTVNVKKNSYQRYFDDAAGRYHDARIDQTVDQYISDQDNGISPANPSESYVAVAQVHQESLQRLETIDTSQIEESESAYAGFSENGSTQEAAFDYVGDSEPAATQEDGFDYVGLSDESESSSYASSEYVGFSDAGAGQETGFDYVGNYENASPQESSVDYVGASNDVGVSSDTGSASIEFSGQVSSGAGAGMSSE